jgi:FkbM family methyltransferase
MERIGLRSRTSFELHLRGLRRSVRLGLEQVGLRPRRSFALNELDLRLLPFLSPRRRGFFVEAGANDGISQSNTAYLERYLGWRGLLIEPIAALAASCRANRVRATVERCALVPLDFPDREVEMEYCNLMSLVRGARGSSPADAAHLERGKAFLSPQESTYVERVPARPLSDVLDAHLVTKIDLLSLDVEGFEANVLRGLDFERHRPRLILVEANDPAAIQEVLGPRYDLAAVLSHHDRLYRSRDDGRR